MSTISLIHTVFVFWSLSLHLSISQHQHQRATTANTHTHDKHTHPGRALTFILSLTDDAWREEWGGALWWLNSEPTSFIPRFNSLILFIPSIRTFHMVTPVIGGGTCTTIVLYYTPFIIHLFNTLSFYHIYLCTPIIHVYKPYVTL